MRGNDAATHDDRLPADLADSLADLGLLDPGDRPPARALAGGVSSDIWRVELAEGAACIKRARARLRVAAEWRAPLDRNAHEVAWIRRAREVVPGCAPEILGHDPRAHAFAMRFLDPARYPVWKERLHAGETDPAVAAAVGERLGRIHAAVAGDADVERAFATDEAFHAIRLDPYLLAAARVHPDRADALEDLAAVTAATRRTLVHGDVSPKNLLVGPEGPVFLDAECAWYGDPAFDLAFCLNHLLLKCLWVPSARERLLGLYATLTRSYLGHVAWEAPASLERRAARLLPGLLLARVDGKSPVEYLTEESDRDSVRRAARDLLAAPVATLDEVAAAWAREINA